MKLLPTTDDSVAEDGSIPSFWYRECSYTCSNELKPYFKPEPFIAWVKDNESLDRKPIPKP